MNLSLYCSVADACRIAGVSRPYMHVLIKAGKVRAEKIGGVYAVLRSDAARFERQPGRGRPPKAAGRKPPAKSRRRTRRG